LYFELVGGCDIRTAGAPKENEWNDLRNHEGESMKSTIIAGVLICLASAACAQDVATAFEGFCGEWMHKLEEREQANVTHIKWESNADGVQGAYVGYTHEHTCVMKDGTNSVPIGKINYREVRYEKRGGSIAEAEQSPPRPIEITEVTEIFRYSKGKWVY